MLKKGESFANWVEGRRRGGVKETAFPFLYLKISSVKYSNSLYTVKRGSAITPLRPSFSSKPSHPVFGLTDKHSLLANCNVFTRSQVTGWQCLRGASDRTLGGPFLVNSHELHHSHGESGG